MTKLLTAVVFAVLAFPALAHGPRPGPYRYHHHPMYGWVAPAVIGGVIGYAMTRPMPPPPAVIAQTLPPAPVGYHYDQMLDAGCNCYRWVLIAN